MLHTTDPRTGTERPTNIEETGTAELDSILDAAKAAAADLASRDRVWRARMLLAMADALDAKGDELVSSAVAETGLERARLVGEVHRSSQQFRFFASVIAEGSYLEIAIDHAEETPAGRQPEVRRLLVPIGPVAVFGSSNFPFAFSVAGGDTASALAAGNAVVVKAHSSHLRVSQLSFETLRSAALSVGAPDGTVQIVYGQAAGAALVGHPAIRAVSFTGSLATGQILLEIVGRRPDPIPFFGELSSLNPFIVSPAAAKVRAVEIAHGLVNSVTSSGGQLCTKPGIAFVPRGAARLIDELQARIGNHGGSVLLNKRIATAFAETSRRLQDAGGAAVLAMGGTGGEGFVVRPTLLSVDVESFTDAVTGEAFGPLLVLALYDDVSDVHEAVQRVPYSLTATIHSEPSELEFRKSLILAVQDRVGRIVFDGYPTGVRVSWAQHHGGPWPATNSQHTSVGSTAIRRFMRPLAWQDAPSDVLPQDLQDLVRVPKRIDGILTLPAGRAASSGTAER